MQDRKLVAKLAAFQSVGQIGLYCWHNPLALVHFLFFLVWVFFPPPPPPFLILIFCFFFTCIFCWFPTFTSCCFTYPLAALFSGVVFRTRMRKGRVSCYVLQLFIKRSVVKSRGVSRSGIICSMTMNPLKLDSTLS